MKISRTKRELQATRYETLDKIVIDNGLYCYLVGHQYPLSGYAPVKAIGAINRVKELLKFPTKYNREIATKVLKPYLRSPAQLLPITREIQKLIPTATGYIISYILEYDSAYRLRLQDLLTETTKERLLQSPIKEIWRLNAINKQRDYEAVHKKIFLIALFLTVLICLPNKRKAFKTALQQSQFTNFQLQENDIYWINRWTDYARPH